MVKSRRSRLFTGLFTLVAALGLAHAQHPLVGTYVEPTIGFVVAFELDQTGQLAGTLYGSGAPLPLTIQSDQQTASGWFLLEGQTTGFSAQLQADGSTLLVWLYQLDAAGQPIPGSDEQYTATRQQVELPTPTAPEQPPLSPPLVAPPVVQPPVVTPPPMPLPPTPQPPLSPEPPISLPPAVIPPVSQPPLTPPAVGSAQQLTGRWQTNLQLPDGIMLVVVDFNADGTYWEEGYVDGMQSGWFTGSWTLSADNLLHQNTTGFSPQFCVRDQCTENSSSGPTTSLVQFMGPDTVILTLKDDSGQQPMQLQYERVSGAGAQPQLPGGGG